MVRPLILAALFAGAVLLLTLRMVALQAVTDGELRRKATADLAEQQGRCRSLGSRRLREQCAARVPAPRPTTPPVIDDRRRV